MESDEEDGCRPSPLSLVSETSHEHSFTLIVDARGPEPSCVYILLFVFVFPHFSLLLHGKIGFTAIACTLEEAHSMFEEATRLLNHVAEERE